MKKILVSATAIIGLLISTNSAMAQYHGRDDRYDRDDRYERNDRYGRESRYDHDRRYDMNDRYRNDRYYNGRGNGYYNRQRLVWATPHRYNYDRHVYFPDYQVFYDPYRGGYEYMRGNRWIFSNILPSFLANVDLGRARVQILSGVPVTTAPHTYYNQYYRQYPPRVYRNW